jgi:hypothetical protein
MHCLSRNLQGQKTPLFYAPRVKIKFPNLLLFVLFGFAVPAVAADFTVINTADTGPGSLGQAILDANALPGLDRIVFNIPGPGPHKIKLSPDGLPNVRDPIIIDGYTQQGAVPNTLPNGNNAIIKIQIDGAYDEGPGLEYAIVLSAGAAGSTVRGLSITGLVTFGGAGPYEPGAAIRIVLDGHNTIEGNFLGLEPDGTSARGNPAGVEVGTNGNAIGGSSPAARNVIAGNNYGIILLGPNGNTVSGNFIGTDASGTRARGQGTGILVLSDNTTNTTIGGTTPEKANVISGNFGPGIKLGVSGDFIIPANDVVIAGNLIGIAANGIDPLPNHEDGINIFGARNVIGGLDPAAANTIAYNQGAGVAVVHGSDSFPSIGNRILSNAIIGTSHPGIDLNGDGLTSNDLGDTDTGPNNLQNFPVITLVDPPAANGDITIHGELNSTPSSDFLLQFFFYKYPAKPRFLGNLAVTTNAGGRARFDFVAPGLGSVKDAVIAATATDSAGNTSELGGGGAVQLANISTRANIGNGDNILIGGFVIGSRQTVKKVLIRAIGPSLNLPKRLADPYLELYDEHGTLLAKNDDWRSAQQQIMDSGLPPSSDLESAIVASLNGGSYTAQVRGINGGTGIGLIEIYDLDPFPSSDTLRLVNLSTRGLIGANDDVLIGGLIVRGDSAQRLIIRAIGPDLIAVGLPGALPDPTLELRDESGTLLAANDNWRDTQEQEIQSTQLAPNDNRDSAIVATLAPGFYTALVRGKQNATGLGLVEVYTLPPPLSAASSDISSAGQ